MKKLINQLILLSTLASGNIFAVCCNKTEFNGCVVRTEPVTPIRQIDIPIWITCPGTYQLVEDITYNGFTDPANPNPVTPFTGKMGIGINAPGVVLDLDGHTFTITGTNTVGITTYDTKNLSGNYIAQANNCTIKNGVIIGDSNFKSTLLGIQLTSNNTTVSNITVSNCNRGITYAPVNFTLNALNLAVAVDQGTIITGITLDNYYALLNNTGLNLFAGNTETAIFNSLFEENGTGIITGGMLTMDNCTVLNSVQNGVEAKSASTSVNWNIRNTSILNSGLNGLMIVGAQGVLVSDTQINDSGADGLIIGIRKGDSCLLERVQVFNAKGMLLRMDNTNNFAANDCQFINYLQNPLPNNSPAAPAVRIEDAFNATLSNCQISSASGTADGCLIRNSQGVTCDNCVINLTSTQSANPPSGFVLQGSVSASSIKNCSVNGLFSQGIALTRNELNGINEGILLENNLIEGALDDAIFVSEATSSILLGNIIVRNQGNGITLDGTSSQSLIRDNIIMNNNGVGLVDEGCGNRVSQNLLSGNCK